MRFGASAGVDVDVSAMVLRSSSCDTLCLDLVASIPGTEQPVNSMQRKSVVSRFIASAVLALQLFSGVEIFKNGIIYGIRY